MRQSLRTMLIICYIAIVGSAYLLTNEPKEFIKIMFYLMIAITVFCFPLFVLRVYSLFS